MPDPLVFFVAATVVLLFSAWAGWQVGGRRNRKPAIMPDRVWLCDGCTSFNDPTHLTCYRCHRPRPVDAREVEPDPDFKIDQQFSKSKGSTMWGASSPWLAAEEPLRDAWLSERARSSGAAPAESDPDPEVRADPAAEATQAVSAVVDPDDAPLASSMDTAVDSQLHDDEP